MHLISTENGPIRSTILQVSCIMANGLPSNLFSQPVQHRNRDVENTLNFHVYNHTSQCTAVSARQFVKGCYGRRDKTPAEESSSPIFSFVSGQSL